MIYANRCYILSPVLIKTWVVSLSDESRIKPINKFNYIENLKSARGCNLSQLALAFLNINSLRLKFDNLVE